MRGVRNACLDGGAIGKKNLSVECRIRAKKHTGKKKKKKAGLRLNQGSADE